MPVIILQLRMFIQSYTQREKHSFNMTYVIIKVIILTDDAASNTSANTTMAKLTFKHLFAKKYCRNTQLNNICKVLRSWAWISRHPTNCIECTSNSNLYTTYREKKQTFPVSANKTMYIFCIHSMTNHSFLSNHDKLHNIVYFCIVLNPMPKIRITTHVQLWITGVGKFVK